MYLYIFYKFLKKFSLKGVFLKNFSIKIVKKKNLFFKKKSFKNSLISKRLSFVLKRRKSLKMFKSKKIDNGNFFLKKFFFKILLKNRKFFKNFFFLNDKIRQKKITKLIYKNKIYKNNLKNISYEYTLLNILLRSRLFFFIKDTLKFIKNNFVFVNGIIVSDFNYFLNSGDCVQLIITNNYYKYIHFSRKLLKKKLAIYKFNTWRFFKQKFFKKKQHLKIKKKKMPKFLHLFFLFKLNIPKIIEVDYMTLTLFLLKKENLFNQSSYYLNKPFSFKLFSMYNFKKIN
jgi:hypothetical protein